MAEARFTVIGCGGIGSNLANLIARLGGRRFALFDPDDVAEENVAPGWFGVGDIGIPKVHSIVDGFSVLFDLQLSLSDHQENFDGQPTPSDVVFVCTDSMDSRRAAWENRSALAGWRLWIDCRMGRDQCSVYVVWNEVSRRDEYYEAYETALDLPDAPLPCGMKATAALTVGMLPGLVGTVLYRVCNGKLPPLHLFYKMADAFFTCVEPKGE